jgi:hypothetical protein
MTIYIEPMKDFPYDVNRREGTYFDRNGFQVDDSVMKPHYCVGYEGNDPRLSAWARKQSKGLTNFATFFEGSTAEEKRLIIWHKLQTKTLDRRLARFFDRFREEPLFLWYLSTYDLPTAEFIKRFLSWYLQQ